MKLELKQGDVFEKINEIPNESIDLVITSPAYWGLRNYGIDGQLGLEPTMEAYLDNTMRWVKEVWRVLKPSGSLIINLGDCFIGGGRGSEETRVEGKQKGEGFAGGQRGGTESPAIRGGIYKTKQLLSVSSFAYCRIVSETDFICRGEHIWCKPNVPSPIRSRLKHSHEKLFWFVKDADKYYFDEKPWLKRPTQSSIDVDANSRKEGNQRRTPSNHLQGGITKNNIGLRRSNDEQLRYMREKARGQAQLENSEEYRAKHEDTAFPTGSFHKYADDVIEHSWRVVPVGAKQSGFELSDKQLSEHVAPYPENLIRPYILSLCPHDGTVLDPFLGSGTTMRVAMENNRNCIGIDLNEKYLEYAKKRLNWGSGINVEYRG